MKTRAVQILRIGVALAAGGALAGTPLAAARVSFDFSVVVPEVCFVRALAPATLEGNAIVISQVQELCNRSGYRVALEYTPGTLEGATASFAGNQVTLDGSGRVDLLASSYAVNRTSPLIIDLADGAALPTGISLQIDPL
ncbi:MAG: hypothetical protein GC147_12835 [Porphyrobacter sp.]|nr:hypothetical protein [Porphyrobacter sp.]